MPRRHFFTLVFCFFLSGSAGLAYEVLWTRLLGFSFGHTVYAVTTVLAAFMGGLALGSWGIGKLVDRTGHALRFYALLEVTIGLFCLAVPFLLHLAHAAYMSLYPLLSENTLLKTSIQFTLSFTVLMVPTTLMGGTLPAVVKGIVALPERTGRDVAILYGTNTVGAAAGALAAGYWLLPVIGIRATNFLGVAINLGVGIVVLALFRNATVPQAERIIRRDSFAERTAVVRVLLFGFFLSGAVSMAYQIAWVRSLILIIGSSTYAFSAIVVTFLIGLAFGSFLFRSIPGGEKSWFFALLQMGIGATGFLLLPFFNYLPELFLVLFKGYEGSHSYIILIQFLIVFPFVLVPTTLMGMTFPCLAGILTNRLESIGGDVGRLYAYNTLGAIAGSLIAGFILIPQLGAQNTIALGVGINMAVGALLLYLTKPSLAPLLAAGTPLVAALLLLFPSWNKEAMISGVAAHPYRYIRQDGTMDREAFYEPEVLYFKEDISSNIAVTRRFGFNVAFQTNGKPSASVLDLETNFKLAYIPLMHHQNPRRVAVIGLGSGITGGTATLFEDIEVIDIVELNPAVLNVPAYFRDHNFNVLEDPRVAAHTDDGRSFLAGAQEPYDVIVSEPSNPWIAGEANLFTREFMTMVKSRLAAGGVFGQWLQGYTISPEDFKMVIRTFNDVFPGATLWETKTTDYLLIGRVDGWEPNNLEGIRTRIRDNPRLAEAFRSTLKDDPLLSIFRSFRLDSDRLADFAGDGPLNSDDRNILEFEAPKSLYRQEYAQISSEVSRMSSRIFPDSFIDLQGRERENLLLFGRYLADRGLRREAARVFSQIPSLAPPLSTEEGILTFEERRIIEEDFDQKRTIPLLPQVGTFRPEGERDAGIWSEYLDSFTRLSGLVEGEGIDGGAALVLSGLEGVVHASYFTPLAVKPATTYRVTFFLRSEMGEGGEAGVGVIEYDTSIPPERQPSLSFNRKHQVRAKDKVRIMGLQEDWDRHSFLFRTSPSTRMSFLVFYREGAMNAGRVYFDNLSIEEMPEE